MGRGRLGVNPVPRRASDIGNASRQLDEARERLRTLLEELDGPADPDAEQAWLAETHRRSRELDRGAVKAIPAEQVFAQARTELKQP